MKKTFITLVAIVFLSACSNNSTPASETTTAISSTVTQEAPDEPIPDINDKSSYRLTNNNDVSKLSIGDLIKVSGTVSGANQTDFLHKLIVYDGTGLWKVFVDAISNKEPFEVKTKYEFYGFYGGADDGFQSINAYLFEKEE